MKILLIQPPPRKAVKEDIVVPPIGIAYLAAVLEKKRHNISIIDAFADGLDINSLEGGIKIGEMVYRERKCLNFLK